MSGPIRPSLKFGAVVAAAAVVLATGFTIGVIISSDGETADSSSAGGSGPLRQQSATEEQLVAEFDTLRHSLDADVGLAFSPVGADQPPTVLGTWQKGLAWSTIKVPLVIAALRDSASRRPSPAMVSAITLSDNDAATEIWEGLGDPGTASRKIDAVLREMGDPTRLRPAEWCTSRS